MSKMKVWDTVALFVTLVFVTATHTAAGQKTESTDEKETNAASHRIKIREEISATYPKHWTQLAFQSANAFELVTPIPLKEGASSPQAHMLITTEKRAYHGEAVRRLAEIAAGVKTENKFLAICGWPALQRRYKATYPHVQKEGNEEPKIETALWQTTAIAADTTLVRFETVLAPGADERFAADAESIGKSASCPQAVDRTTDFYLRQVRSYAYSNLSTGKILSGWVHLGTSGPPVEALAAAGHGELEIGASFTGQTEVIASNTAVSISNDAGVSFSTSTPLGGFLLSNRGDPSATTGRSGNIYVALLDDPPGPAGGFAAAACTVTVAVTGNSGVSFSLAGAAVSCPVSGSGECTPDQEHIAADTTNAPRNGSGDMNLRHLPSYQWERLHMRIHHERFGEADDCVLDQFRRDFWWTASNRSGGSSKG